MRIVILPSARDDLADGFQFYENQEANLGGYFLESLFSDIDSPHLYAGIHRVVFGSHRLLSKRFPYALLHKGIGNAFRQSCFGLPQRPNIPSPEIAVNKSKTLRLGVLAVKS